MKATYINHYLTDNDVANFARQSFGKLAENFTDDENNKLIQFLARGTTSSSWELLIGNMLSITEHYEAKALATYLRNIPEHWVPFGHPHITLRMQAPIPIKVQLFKHKIGLVESEESRRYISTRPELFIPTFRSAATSVKQGSGSEHPNCDYWDVFYQLICYDAIKMYENMISDGVCPEQARFILPQGCEANWVWTGSLYAFANVYNLRSNSHAQREVQQLAEQIDAIIAPLYPVSWQALTRGAY